MTDQALDHYDTPAWQSIRELAEAKIEQTLDLAPDAAEMAVDIVLKLLAEPDRDMIGAGVAMLDFVGSVHRRGIDQRDLVARIFRAMLDRA